MLNRLLPRRAVVAPVEEKRDLSLRGLQELFRLPNGGYFLATSPHATGALLLNCGPAYAALDRRAAVLGEARPAFQRLEAGKPTDLFSTRELAILERPWSGGSWRQLVAVMEADVAAYGNSYWIRARDELLRLPPEWVTIVTEQVTAPDGEGRIGVLGDRLIGYVVQQPGYAAVPVDPSQMAHYRPAPSAESQWRGESWLASVASDANSDVEMTRYKWQFLRNGAMPSLAVLYESNLDAAQVEQFIPLLNDKFSGSMNAGKIMHLLGGRDVKTVGATLDELAFKAVQGAGETRIASAAGVPATVAGFSEALAGSSLNAGNYIATRRLFADAKIRPLLGSLCDALSHVVELQGSLVSEVLGVRLWYDDSQVSFFQEDVSDEAGIRQLHAQTIRTLIEAGYEPDAAVAAVTTGNFAALVGQHSGLTSVQLQPAAESEPDDADDDAEDDQPPARAAEWRTVTEREPYIVAPNVTVNLPEQRHEAPVVNVNLPEVEPPVVNVAPQMRAEAPVVNVSVPETVVNVVNEAPVVNVPEQRVEVPVIHIDVPAPNVTVEAPVVNVEPAPVVVEQPTRRTKRTVERDEHGRIASVTDEELE